MSQVMIFLFSAVLGAVLSLLFDFFRVCNALLKVNLKRIFFEDVLYFVLSAVITFLYMLVTNMGEIRFYIIWGEVLGWIIYRITIGKLIYKNTLIVVKFFIKWFSRLYKYMVSKLPKDKIKKLFGPIKKLRIKFIKKLKPKKTLRRKLLSKIKDKININFNKNIC